MLVRQTSRHQFLASLFETTPCAGVLQADSAEGADLLLQGGQELYRGQEAEEPLPVLQVPRTWYLPVCNSDQDKIEILDI